MKVIEVIPSFLPLGGAENLVFNLSLFLKKSGVDVTVLSLYANKNEYVTSILKKHNINVIYLNKKVGFDFKCMKDFDKIIKQQKPDIVHLHLNSVIASLLAIFKHRSKFIYTFHTFINRKTYGKKTKFSNILFKYLFKKKLIFPITISNEVDKSFESYFGEFKREIIYNGIDLTKFNYCPDIVKKYDFISVGSFSDVKNNLFMIKCVESLIKEGFDIKYIILGGGKHFKECKEYCLNHNLNSNIQLAGVVNNVHDYLSQSDCLILASHWEGNPLVINEAIASGVWVVANSVGGIVDLIDETCGYLVKPESEEDFILKIKNFIKDKENLKLIIKNNIVFNRARVDLNKTCVKYINVMEKICGEQ